MPKHPRVGDREQPEHHISESTHVDGAQGPWGNPKPEGKKENEGMIGDIAELQHELETLKAENQELKEKLSSIEAERHQELVDAAVEARFRAGFVKDRKAEAERLKDLDDATIVLLREDAERVAEKLAKVQSAGPKAKYTPDDKRALEDAIEETRERLFGHRKEVIS